MKSFPLVCLGSLLLVASQSVFGREAAPRYQFTAGATNVFSVEITVRSEMGSEVTTGNVVLVTKEVGTNFARLACRGSLKSDIKRTPQRGPGMYGGYYPGGMMQNVNVFPEGCEITLDLRGNEIRDGGDYVMAVPLGKLVQSIFAPLPAKSDKVETSEVVAVLDDPLWLGPAESFLNINQNGQPMRMRPYMMGYPQQSIATLAVASKVMTQQKISTADTLEWHRQTKLESLVKTGDESRLVAKSESDFTFDRKAGLLAKVETQGDVTSQTETTSRKAKVSFKARLLSGAELAAALMPLPPVKPRTLSAADLEKIIADLKSPELETRRAAMRQINGANIESPSPELVGLVASMALDSDSYMRMTAANFLGSYATTNEVPILLKLMKDSDWSSRSGAVKALGKLKDERAIQPLADLIARGGNNYGQDASTALMNFGPAAEKAVIGLLNERNVETQRLACTILQQIGTAESLEPLQKLVGESEQQTSQAATEAIRMIKMRQ